MADKDEQKYVYPVEKLDEIIEKMNRGIMPMMDDQMEIEVKMRFRELQKDIFDEDEVDDELTARHRAMMQQHIEEQKRKARKEDVIIIKLNDKQKEELKEEMSSSIVRPNPDSVYNIPDDLLCDSQEKKVIMDKLSRLRNVYYNQADYVNAINIIVESIEFSLTHDYPWLTRDEAIKMYNEGKIKFTYCRRPRLMVDYRTEITDPDILRGIYDGTVVLRDKNDDQEALKRAKRKEPYNAIEVDYDIVGKEAYDKMLDLHRRGYDTPMSTVIKAKATTYNRYSLPAFRGLSGNNANNNDQPMLFDWEHEGAGELYYDQMIGKKWSLSDIMSQINADNNGELSPEFATNASNFLYSMKHTTASDNGWYDYRRGDNDGFVSSTLQVNEKALQMEQNILNAIKMHNPTK